MKHTLRSHLCGVVGFVLAGGVGLAACGLANLAVVASDAWRHPTAFVAASPAAGRSYESENTGWQACGGGRTDRDRERCGGSSNGWYFRCSDGTHLTRVLYECGSQRGAQRELEARVFGLGTTPAEWAPRQVVAYEDGLLVQLGDPKRVEAGVLADGNVWVYARAIGRDLFVIYGPTREHVEELLTANPKYLWPFPLVAPN